MLFGGCARVRSTEERYTRAAAFNTRPRLKLLLRDLVDAVPRLSRRVLREALAPLQQDLRRQILRSAQRRQLALRNNNSLISSASKELGTGVPHLEPRQDLGRVVELPRLIALKPLRVSAPANSLVNPAPLFQQRTVVSHWATIRSWTSAFVLSSLRLRISYTETPIVLPFTATTSTIRVRNLANHTAHARSELRKRGLQRGWI